MLDGAKVYRLPTGHGYIYAPGHPVASRAGIAYVSRVVLYEKTNGRPLECHRCGVTLEWPRLRARHLNEDPSDDRPENVVAQCACCSRLKRASVLMSITLDDKTDTVAGWAARTGMSEPVIRGRLRRGWSTRDALTATPEQAAARHARYLTHDGRTQRVHEWAQEAGMRDSDLSGRLKRGWPVELALSTPVTPRRPRRTETARGPIREDRGVGRDFQPSSGDRAPPTTREFVDLGPKKPKRGELDG